MHAICQSVKSCSKISEFWLVYTWFFDNPRDQRSKTCIESIHQKSISEAKVGEQDLAL